MKSTSLELPRQSEAGIWNRVLPPSDQIPPAVAAWLRDLRFSDADLARMSELSEKAREGCLSAEENSEMELFEHVGDMLSILKAKSRAPKKARRKP